MGRDAALGAAAIRKSGGIVIAQDEASSVVYGMPRAAADMGCVDAMVPLSGLPETVLACVGDLLSHQLRGGPCLLARAIWRPAAARRPRSTAAACSSRVHGHPYASGGRAREARAARRRRAAARRSSFSAPRIPCSICARSSAFPAGTAPSVARAVAWPCWWRRRPLRRPARRRRRRPGLCFPSSHQLAARSIFRARSGAGCAVSRVSRTGTSRCSTSMRSSRPSLERRYA